MPVKQTIPYIDGVFHGEVIKLEGSQHNPVAPIKFDVNGEKKIMLNYAKLMILD